MKIKLAIVEKDEIYLKRLSGIFTANYADSIEVYSFSDFQGALKAAHESRLDLVISYAGDDIEPERLPERCSFAYLVDSASSPDLADYPVISKYQKAELLYKEILNIISERAVDVGAGKSRAEDCGIIAFASPSGGSGSSSLAASCAIRASMHGKRVMYLNLETEGSSDVFFSGGGNFTVSNVIYALKSGTANLSMKLESCLKQDQRGVYFYSASPLALDMAELSEEDIISLIDELAASGFFDVLILDCEFGLDKAHSDILMRADKVVVSSDGSEISGVKVSRAYNALVTREQGKRGGLSEKIQLIYNKFNRATGRTIESINAPNLGTIPCFENATTSQVINQISSMPFFDKIIM